MIRIKLFAAMVCMGFLKRFSEIASLILTKFHVDDPWVNLHKTPLKNFDLLKNIGFFGRLIFPPWYVTKSFKIFFSETAHVILN